MKVVAFRYLAVAIERPTHSLPSICAGVTVLSILGAKNGTERQKTVARWLDGVDNIIETFSAVLRDFALFLSVHSHPLSFPSSMKYANPQKPMTSSHTTTQSFNGMEFSVAFVLPIGTTNNNNNLSIISIQRAAAIITQRIGWYRTEWSREKMSLKCDRTRADRSSSNSNETVGFPPNAITNSARMSRRSS
jgi:hypothetical protein